MSTDSEDSVDLPGDATESALHNALTDMHRSGANVQSTTGSDGDGFDAEASAMQGGDAAVTPPSKCIQAVMCAESTSAEQSVYLHKQIAVSLMPVPIQVNDAIVIMVHALAHIPW